MRALPYPSFRAHEACLALLILASSGCTANNGGPCESSNSSPETPTIISPAIDIIAENLVLSTSEFADDDDDEHKATEFEIWTLNGMEPDQRLWYAEVIESDPLTSVTLDDGEFEVDSDMELEDGKHYGARARHSDLTESCSAWSEWSDYRTFRTDDGSAYLFDQSTIRSFYLDIPPESWESIDDEAVPPGCAPFTRSYYPGTLTFEGVEYPAGLRAKGGCGSARHLQGKTAFKANISWNDPANEGCPEEVRTHGLKRFTFNNMVQDDRQLHEVLGYAFYQELGIPSPRVAYVRLYVNDEFWGLYLNQETIDRRFLDRWFANRRGMLYEGTYWCDLIPGNVPLGVNDEECLSRKFETDECSPARPGDDETNYQLLRQLTNEIRNLPDDGFYPEVEDFFEFDLFLSIWAADSVMANWDGYLFENQNNYRVYHDPSTDRWSMIPAGLDQIFEAHHPIDPWEVGGVLATRCLEEPDCEMAFATRLAEATELFEAMDLPTMAQQFHDQISEHVIEDPRKATSDSEFTTGLTTLQGWLEDRPQEMREKLAEHGF
jgi:hypothetical protein